MSARWQQAPMGTICSIKSGKSNSVDADETAPYAFFDRSKKIKRSSRYLYDCEALIIPGEGSEFLPRHFIGKFDLHQRAYALFDFVQSIDVKFLYYYLIHSKDYFPRVAVGATVKSLRLRHFEQLPVPIPPLQDQKRIVTILDRALTAIATTKSNTEENLRSGRALLDSQLRYIFSERSSSWGRRVPLSSILSAQPRNGWSPPLEYQNGKGTPVLTLSSVTGFEYDGTRVKMTSAPTEEGAHYWLRPGELLITRSNTRELVGHVAIYDGNPAKAICCDLIMKMQVDPRVADTRFIYYYLRSAEARTYFTTIAHGASSTMKKIGKATVQNIRVPLPPLNQQKSTAATLDQISGSAKQLQAKYLKKLDALEALQRTLLDKAFTGNL